MPCWKLDMEGLDSVYRHLYVVFMFEAEQKHF